MQERRRKLAWLITLVLLMGLALSCCACTHILCHDCNPNGLCPICEFIEASLRGAFVLFLLLGFWTLLYITVRLANASRQHSTIFIPLVARKIRLDD